MSAANASIAASEAQRAYQACVDYYNNTYRPLGGYKAIVAGVDGNGTHCYWSYNSNSIGNAIRSANGACERHYNHCFLFASSGEGLSSWSQRISDMGGDDGTRYSGGNGDAAAAIVNGMALGLAAGAMGYRHSYTPPRPVYRSPPRYNGGSTNTCVGYGACSAR
jgi:hypothetical protein